MFSNLRLSCSHLHVRRGALLASASMGALMLAASGVAVAQIVPPSPPCAAVVAVVTCTGNLAAGVSIINPPVFNTLIVNPTLGAGPEITPASGVDGIRFFSNRDVTVTSIADIMTSGSGRGIYARASNGAVTVKSTGDITSTSDPANGRNSVGIKAMTGNTTASAIDITNVGDIKATSFGIEASSSGGIVINSTGNITSGFGQSSISNYGHGIIATTLGDRTGKVPSVNNDITIRNTGDIQAGGRGSGIRAYSIYADSADISITHVNGTITGGNGSSYGAISVFSTVKSVDVPVDGTITATVTTSGVVKGSGSNGKGITFDLYSYSPGAKMNGTVVVTSSGSVEGAAGIGGVAISSRGSTCRSGDGCDSDASASVNMSVENSGTVTGRVMLSGSGINSFKNMSGGVFNMGSKVDLGGGNNTLSNAGKLSPGGDGAVSTVEVNGDLLQTPGGTMLIDVNGATSTADRINVTGKADLAGTVTVNVLNPVSTNQQFTILSAMGGVKYSGLTLAGGLPIGFSLLYPDDYHLVLDVTVDFSLDEGDLNRNQTALGDNLNAIINAGAGRVAPVTNALLGITDRDRYQDALNQLLPEHYLNLQAATLFAAEDFAQSLMSCREREGAYAVIAEGQCLWVEADASRLEQDGMNEQVNSEQDSYRFAAGGQFGFSEQWHMGVALRYETLEQDTGNFAESDGQRFHAGAALKYNEGPLLLAGAVSAGRTWYDTDRHFGFGGLGSASSSHEVDYLNGLLRAAYLVPLGDFYLKPIADLNVTHVSSDGFTEDDGGGAALKVDDADGTYVALSPALEAGGEWRLASGTLIKPFIGGGVTWNGENTFAGTASFADGPARAGSFETRTEIDEVMANVAAGIDILGTGGFDLRLRYEGAFGETVTSQSLALRAAMRF